MASGIRANHELTCQVLLGAKAEYGVNDYKRQQGAGGTERFRKVLRFGGNVLYKLNYNIYLIGRYDSERKDVNVADSDYTVHKFMIGTTLQY
ncbi:MAG: hypothetical protein FD153_1539 [Rhodospirillaceae bacterium]|nr:MAG: hypothetical protein FD153_1539 [Rhodospirillaceae bacterium]